MTFADENIVDFINIFNQSKPVICGFKGCLGVVLLKDTKSNNTFFTYSKWESEDALENYRKSQIFGSIWKKTKALFSEKAQAWSTVEF